MQEVGLIINQILQQKKMWNRCRQLLIIDKWNELVGREIGAVTRAKQVNKKVIHVLVKDSTWSYHLTLLKPQLLEKINRFAGEAMIKDIFFQIGDVGQTGMNVNEEKISVQPASDEECFLEKIKKLKKLVSSND